MKKKAVFGAMTGKLGATLLNISTSNCHPAVAEQPTKKTKTAQILEKTLNREVSCAFV
jgi:hypothetical protein